jgi:hypothetical protein
MNRGLLTALLLLSLAPALNAGPPKRPSGAFVLDEVENGLRRYRAEKRPEYRSMWLWRLAPGLDPRVAVALGEALDDPQLRWDGCALLGIYYVPSDEITGDTSACFDVWWKKNAADLRRRAGERPK